MAKAQWEFLVDVHRKDPDIEKLSDVLDERGRDGWDLVAVAARDRRHFLAFFKRALATEPQG
jgi:hypothetical protein